MKPSKRRTKGVPAGGIQVGAEASGAAPTQRAEDALGESQALLNAIVDSTSDLIWSVDPDNFSLLTFNHSLSDYFLRWCGIRLQPGTGPEDHFPSKDLVDRWRGLYQRALSEGSYTTEYHVTAGSSILQLTFNLLRRDGQIFGISVFGKDITERKRAEAALQQKSQELDSFFNVSLDLLCIANTDGYFLRLNPAWESTLGYTRDELKSKRFFDFIHPDDGKATLETIATLASRRNVVDFTNRYRCKDGEYRWLQWQAAPAGDLIYAAARDITDRKRAEEDLRASEARFRTLITDAPVAIGVARNGITRYANTAYVHLFGLQNPEETFGRPILDQFAPHCHEQVKDILRRRQLGLPAPTEYESVGMRKDGSTFPMHVAVSQVELEDGPVTLGFLTDLTERQRAEEELRLARFSVDHASDAITWADPQGRIVYANEAACRYLGYSREEFHSLTISDLDRKLPKDAWPKRWAELKTRGSVTLETQHETKQGRVFPVEVTATYLEFGGKEYSFAFVRDITERKRAEEALQASEARYRFLFENNVAAIIRSTLDGCIVDCNRPAARILGYESPLEMVGLNMRDIHCDPARRAELITRLHAEKTLTGVDLRFWHKDGRPLWIIANLSLTAADGSGEVFAQGTLIDITERKLAEEELRKLSLAVEQSPATVVITDVHGDIEYVNPKFTQLTGYTLEEARGQNPRILKSGLVPAATYEELWKTVLSGNEWRGEFANRKKNGELYWESASIVPIRDSGGVITHLLAVKEDITKRKAAEEALRRSEQRYKDFISHTHEGVWRVEMEQPIPIDLPVEEVLEKLMRFGYIAECNLAHARIMGYSAPEEMIGKYLRDLIPPSDQERLESLRAAAHGGLGSRTLEFRALGRSGNVQHLLRTEIPIVENGMFVRAWGITRDITNVKVAEEALRESEERFRATFEYAGVGMALVDMQGHPVKSNPTLTKLLGYSEQELSRMAFTEFTHPDDRDLDWRLFGELMAGKRDKYEIEKRYFKKDGSMVWGLLTVSLVSVGSGRPAYGVGMVQDITERKRAETALRESDERLRSLFENATVGIYRTTPAGKILVANPALVKMLGYGSMEELVERNLEDQGFEPDYPREFFHGRMGQDGEVKGLEVAWKKQDGSAIFVRESARAIRGEGNQILYYDGFVEDITERKRAEEALRKSEERFRLFMNMSPTIAWMKDEQGRYVYVSETHEKRVGVRMADQMGHTDFDIYPRATAEQFRRNDQAALEAGHPIEIIEETVSLQGAPCYWLAYKFPIHDVSGQVFVAGIASDITERQRMEKELHDSLEQLRAFAGRLQSVREEERKRVAREIHDQLGQALTAIKIDLSSLLRELPRGEQQPAKRMASILKLVDESIQTVRRISTELRPGMLDDLGLVATIEWAGEDFQARTGTMCQVDLPQEDMVIDPERATAIFRILQETLTNVARHAGASAVQVRLALEDNGLTLEVHDNGKGITEDKLSAGRSLGILGMRERAMLLGGELTIQGFPGKGTTVRVRIPAARRT
jgi:PAS domain S-box-containing protein